MDINRINELAKILNDNALTVLELEEGAERVRLEKNNTAVPSAPTVVSAPVVQSTVVDASEIREEQKEDRCYKEIKSPMVGVFYSSPSPDAEPFVKVGDSVKKGDVVCIVEAMKLMNEITATCDGEIAEICVNNGDVVEFSQILFKLV